MISLSRNLLKNSGCGFTTMVTGNYACYDKSQSYNWLPEENIPAALLSASVSPMTLNSDKQHIISLDWMPLP